MHHRILSQAKTLIPPLTSSQYKGSSGRVAVLGGSETYCGAPTLAAMAALRTGADLVHVFCPPSAAVPIKSYAPDLVVRPCLCEERLDEALNSFSKIHALIIGPGLGPTEDARNLASRALKHALMETDIPIVIDADGIGVLLADPSLVKKTLQEKYQHQKSSSSSSSLVSSMHPRVTITPNAMEFKRLATAVGGNLQGTGDEGSHRQESVAIAIAEALDVTVVVKGSRDLLCMPASTAAATPVSSEENPTVTALVGPEGGSLRRVAGQGDVFSGICGTFAAWRFIHHQRAPHSTTRSSDDDNDDGNGVHEALACVYASSAVMREAQEHAFAAKRRGYIASDLLPLIPDAVYEVLEKDSE